MAVSDLPHRLRGEITKDGWIMTQFNETFDPRTNVTTQNIIRTNTVYEGEYVASYPVSNSVLLTAIIHRLIDQIETIDDTVLALLNGCAVDELDTAPWLVLRDRFEELGESECVLCVNVIIYQFAAHYASGYWLTDYTWDVIFKKAYERLQATRAALVGLFDGTGCHLPDLLTPQR